MLSIPERTPCWWLIISYCLVVLFLALICVAIGPGRQPKSFWWHINKWSYHFVIYFGKATVLFSILFLYSVFSYYGTQSREAAILFIFWGIYIALLPLRLPQFIQSLFCRSKNEFEEVGNVIRMEYPSLVVVETKSNINWTHDDIYFANLADGKTHYLLPVFQHMQNNRQLGTAIMLDRVSQPKLNFTEGKVFSDRNTKILRKDLLVKHLGLEESQNPIGTVSEGTTIGKLRFEIWSNTNAWKGMLVFCIENGEKVFYQVLDGFTKTEDLTSNERGFTVVEAIQLGTWNAERGFSKYKWLPCINSLVFGYSIADSTANLLDETKQLSLGCIPYSDFPVSFDLEKIRSHHLAILGTTGKGKTELALTLIKQAIANGMKIFVVNLTLKYAPRLKNEAPALISLECAEIAQLKHLIAAVDTGTFGAKNEKKELHDYIMTLAPKVTSKIEDFINSDDLKLGILELSEMSNTEAVVRVIELFVTAIFNSYRNTSNLQPIWIVLEEAHTIVPETGKTGISDYSTQAAIIGRISQIALQGRKYNVGLMVLAQRTANVSKTVLTQCNSIISFAQYDKTGLEFLENFFGNDYAKTVPNLEFLEAIAYGYGVKSDRPVMLKFHKKSAEELGETIISDPDLVLDQRSEDDTENADFIDQILDVESGEQDMEGDQFTDDDDIPF